MILIRSRLNSINVEEVDHDRMMKWHHSIIYSEPVFLMCLCLLRGPFIACWPGDDLVMINAKNMQQGLNLALQAYIKRASKALHKVVLRKY